MPVESSAPMQPILSPFINWKRPSTILPSSPVYRSSSDEECADMDWDSLGFGLVPADFMYTMKCSTDVNFTKGLLCRYGNIESSPAACVLKLWKERTDMQYLVSRWIQKSSLITIRSLRTLWISVP